MYGVLRLLVRAALHLYFRKIHVDLRTAPGPAQPLLLACNHPNSFLDALLVATHLPHRMHFLARGDAFRKPIADKLLRALFMLPVFRLSEGRPELLRTEASFQAALGVLRTGRSVLVFSEGLSENEAGLRPLGKGTARIARLAWEVDLPVQVLPVWLEYRDFHRPFTEVSLRTGTVLANGEIPLMPQAAFLRSFNTSLSERLLAASLPNAALVIDHGHAVEKVLLAIPVFIGLILHAPWYFSIRAIAAASTKGSVFFDSVLFGLLLLSYPLWLLVLAGIGLLLGLKMWAATVLLLGPVTLLALRKW